MPRDATIELACDAELAWSLLADPCLAPEWVPGVADAELVEADPGGRPRRVRFVGMPSAASMVYVVAYTHDEATRRMAWTTEGEADRHLRGEARIDELGPGRCRLTYSLAAATTGTVPPWARQALADDTAPRVVEAFARFVERRRR